MDSQYDIPYPRIPDDSDETFHWHKNIAPKLAILAIGLFVAVFDATCKSGNTISEETYRMRRTKIGRFLVPKVIDAVADHLLERRPIEEDPVHTIAQLSPKPHHSTGEASGPVN